MFVRSLFKTNHVDVLTEREMLQKGGTELYFRGIADGLNKTYAARLHGMINKYFHNTCLRGEWRHMNRKIKATQTKSDGTSSKKSTSSLQL